LETLECILKKYGGKFYAEFMWLSKINIITIIYLCRDSIFWVFGKFNIFVRHSYQTCDHFRL